MTRPSTGIRPQIPRLSLRFAVGPFDRTSSILSAPTETHGTGLDSQRGGKKPLCSCQEPARFGRVVSRHGVVVAVPIQRLRFIRIRESGNLQSKGWRFSISAPSITYPLLELVLRATPMVRPSPLQSAPARSRRLWGALLLAPQKGWTLDQRDDATEIGGASRYRRKTNLGTQSPPH